MQDVNLKLRQLDLVTAALLPVAAISRLLAE